MRAIVAAACAILLAGAVFVSFVVLQIFGHNWHGWEPWPAPAEEPIATAEPPRSVPPQEPIVAAPVPDRPAGYETMREKVIRARKAADERRRQYWAAAECQTTAPEGRVCDPALDG
jgi:hypothetical protein